MDSGAVQTHAHEYDQQHHNSHNVGAQQVAHGEEQPHPDLEKKSVLKKVKQKAKKIKDTITKHGHHDHEHGHEYHYDDQHIPDDHDLDEEDEDEDMVEDPEVHGAPIYDSTTVRSAAPGKVNTIGRPGVNFGGPTVMEEEPHHEPRVIVSPTTGINQSRPTDPTRTFVEGEKAVHPKLNLETPMHLEEDPHAPRSITQAYDPANYQTKVTDPTGAGGAEIDITPVEKSFSSMTVHNEPQPKVLPTVPETHCPSAGIHSQFAPGLSTSTKTHYPSAESYGQYLPQPSSEIKTQYPKSQSHDQFLPELSTPTKAQCPSTKIHDQHLPQQSSATKTQYPSSGSHDQFAPESELSTPTKTQYPSTKIHDQPLPLPQQSSAAKTQYPLSGSHDQFTPDLSTEPKIQQIHDQHLPLPQESSATKTQYPLSDQFTPELSTEPNIQYPSTKIHDQHLPQQSSPTNTQYPSSGSSHDQFLPEFSTQPKTPPTYTITTTPVEEPHYKPMEEPSNESSYTDKISSATSAIADKAVTAKNAVASKLGYGNNDNDNYENKTTQTKHEEENTDNEKPSTISSATSAIAGKAVSAKNTVASKLGFGDDTDNNKARTTTNEEKENHHAASPTEHGKSVAESPTDKLAVAGVGSGVKSKVSGTEMEQDKGVSAREYLVEKLRPGEEDSALSEVISETMHKEEPVEVTGEGGAHGRSQGKVTESEEVKRRLGGEDAKAEKRYQKMYANSPGEGVLDKVKGMVGSWFTAENQSSQDSSTNYGAGVEQVNQGAGERRLQESSN